jgi:hypothetical protein
MFRIIKLLYLSVKRDIGIPLEWSSFRFVILLVMLVEFDSGPFAVDYVFVLVDLNHALAKSIPKMIKTLFYFYEKRITRSSMDDR